MRALSLFGELTNWKEDEAVLDEGEGRFAEGGFLRFWGVAERDMLEVVEEDAVRKGLSVEGADVALEKEGRGSLEGVPLS
jgi:hypothetical protein